MFSQAPQDNTSIQDRYTAGRLVRDQLERIGLGSVADFFNQPGAAMADEPSVTISRRRGRPFSPIETVVAPEEDAGATSALLSLTRKLESDAAEQARKNSELYKLLIQSGLG